MEVTYKGNDIGVIIVDFKEYRNTYIIEPGSTEIIEFSYGNGDYVVRTARHIGEGNLEEIDRWDVAINLKDPVIANKGKGYYSKGDSLGIEWRTVDEVFDYVNREFQYDDGIDVTSLNYYKPDLKRFKEERLGICVDYASLMGTTLRSKGYAVRFPVGYTTSGQYHMWVEVYEAEKDSWVGYDPTFGIIEDIEWEASGYY